MDKDKCTGYHGTSLHLIESIVTDGLLKPGTINVKGNEIKIPPDHIHRNAIVNNINNFAEAVFLSPSFLYCTLTAYAKPFVYKNAQYLPILECFVEKGKYQELPLTTETYRKMLQPGEDANKIEWRIEDPGAVHVYCLHLCEQFSVYQ